MADYTIRIESDSSAVDRDLERLEGSVRRLNSNAQVKFQLPDFNSAVGAVNQLAQGLQRVYQVARLVPIFQDVEEAVVLTADAVSQLGDGLVALSQATPGGILSISFDRAAASADNLTKAVARVGFTVFGVTQSVNTLRASFEGFFKETVGREIRLQETLLRTRATLVSTARIMADGQEITDPYKALIAIEPQVTRTIESIRRRSLDIAGTTSEAIISTFGIIASQIGEIGGSFKDAEDLAISFAAALGTIGLADPALASQEIGSIMRGTIDRNSILARSLQISNEDIAKAKQQGNLVEFITERLEGFVAGQKAAAQGFAGLTSNIAEFAQEVNRSLGKPVLDPILQGLTAIFSTLGGIFEEAKGSAEAVGLVVAQVMTGLGRAAGGAPTLQLFSPESVKQSAGELEKLLADAFLVVQDEIDNFVPRLSQIIDSFSGAFAQAGAGIADFAAAFAEFKFAQFDVFVQSIATLGTLLNNVILPALTSVLSVYADILRNPVAQYISTISAQMGILERVGLLPLARFAVILPGIIESVRTFTGWISTAANAIGTAISKAIAAATAAFTNLVAVVVTTGTKIAATISAALSTALAVLANLGLQAQAFFTQLAAQVLRAAPQLAGLVTPLTQIAAAFGRMGVSATNASKNVGVASTTINANLKSVQAQAEAVNVSLQKTGANIQISLGKAGAAVKSFAGAQALAMGAFLGKLLLIQVAIGVIFDLWARFQAQQANVQASERAELALQRLNGTLKDVDESSSLVLRKAKEFEQSRVDQQVASITEEVEKLNAELERNAQGGWWERIKAAFLNGDATQRGPQWAEGALDRRRDALTQRREELLAEQRRLLAQREAEEREAAIELQARRREENQERLQELERNHRDAMFQLEQQVARQRIQIFETEERIRIQAQTRANEEAIRGEQGLSRVILERLNEYITTKENAELDLERQKQELTLELQGIEKATVDYKYATEKRIAELRKEVAKFEQETEKWKTREAISRAQAVESAIAAGTAFGPASPEGVIARTGGQPGTPGAGQSTGPHLDARWADRRKITAADVDKYIRVNGMKPSQFGVTSGFGPRNLFGRDFHYGIDFGTPQGSPITLTGGAQFLSPFDAGAGGGGLRLKTPEGEMQLLHILGGSISAPKPGAIGTGGSSLNSSNTKSLAELYQLARGAGFNREQAITMAAIAMGESTGRPGAHNNKGNDNSYGLWQINMLGSMGPQRRQALGLSSNEQLKDPATNARAAKFVFDEVGGSFDPWTVYTRGIYKQYIDQARAAAAAVDAGGGAVSSAGPVPTLDLSRFEGMSAEQAKLNNQLAIGRQRLQELQEKLAEITTKEAFDRITENLFPEIDFEAIDNETKALRTRMEAVAAATGSPLERAEQVEQKVLEKRLEFLDKEEQQYLERAQKLEGITAEELETIRKRIRTQIEEEKQNQRTLFAKQKEQRAIESVTQGLIDLQQAARDINLSFESDRDQLLLQRQELLLSPEDRRDPVQARLRRFDFDQAERRRRLESESPELLADPLFAVRFEQNAQAARAFQEQLGELEQELTDLADKAELAQNLSSTITRGLADTFTAALTGGNLMDAAQNFSGALIDTVMGELVEYIFQPVQDRLENVFRDLLGITDEDAEKLEVERSHTIALEKHTAALTGASTPGAAAASATGALGPQSISVVPFGASAANNIRPLFPTNLDLGVTGDLNADLTGLTTNLQNLSFSTKDLFNSTLDLAGTFNNLPQATASAANATQQFVSGLGVFVSGVMGIVGGIQQIAQGGTGNILSGLSSTLISVGSLFLGGGGGFLGGLFGRASGGQYGINTPYKVGELGPELAFPTNAGRIYSTGQALDLFRATNASVDAAGNRIAMSPEDEAQAAVDVLGVDPGMAANGNPVRGTSFVQGRPGSPFARSGGMNSTNRMQSVMSVLSRSNSSVERLIQTAREERMARGGGGSYSVEYIQAGNMNLVTTDQVDSLVQRMNEMKQEAITEGARLGQSRMVSDMRKRPSFRRNVGL